MTKKSLIGRRRKQRRRHKSTQKSGTTLDTVHDAVEYDIWCNVLKETFFIDEIDEDVNVILDNEFIDSDGCKADEFYVILDKPYRYCSDINLDEFVRSERLKRFSELREKSKHEIRNENFMYMKSSSDLKYVQMYDSDEHWETPRVKTCVCVDRDFRLSVSVHGRLIPDNHSIYNITGRYCTSVQLVKHVLYEVEKYDICSGNEDKELHNLVQVGAYMDVSGDYKYQGYKESFYIGNTIRSTKCNFILKSKTSSRCEHCNIYRKTLRKALTRRQNMPKVATPEKDWTKSKVSNNNLTERQKFFKIQQLKSYSNQLETEVAKLKREIKRKILTEGVILEDSAGKDMAEIMESADKDVHRSYPDENSYERLFWQQQKKYLDLEKKHGMRWHPAIIKWCIFLKSKSSATYDALRNSGFIKLPSERTLFDYTNVTKKGTGFHADVVDLLIDDMEDFKGHKRIVGLLQDEVKIKSDLVYDRHTGELIGFVDLGNMNNDLKTMLDEDGQTLAKYVLVLMVRGVSTKLKYPLAHFSTNGVQSDELFSILWEAIEILETDVGLEVLFITSDGASPNRRFIKLHQADNAMRTVFSSLNIFAPVPREIYFISDPPHLLKTARNCFSNSYSHKKTRRMWKDGFDISWTHIVNLFNDYCRGPFRLCKKLSKDHINITPFGAMKVKFATQVLSRTVATALEMNYDNRVSETVCFIRLMDKFFDCLNTRHLGEAARKRNENLREYRAVDDERLTWMQNDFLGYFRSWKTSVINRQGDFTKTQINGMMLSYQTLEGFEITVHSIVNCVRYCLNAGMDFVLTERFNQDPLEQHFGLHRSNLGSNTNPSLSDLNNSMVQMRTVGSQAIAPFRSNVTRQCEERPALNGAPLRKRRRTN